MRVRDCGFRGRLIEPARDDGDSVRAPGCAFRVRCDSVFRV